MFHLNNGVLFSGLSVSENSFAIKEFQVTAGYGVKKKKKNPGSKNYQSISA